MSTPRSTSRKKKAAPVVESAIPQPVSMINSVPVVDAPAAHSESPLPMMPTSMPTSGGNDAAATLNQMGQELERLRQENTRLINGYSQLLLEGSNLILKRPTGAGIPMTEWALNILGGKQPEPLGAKLPDYEEHRVAPSPHRPDGQPYEVVNSPYKALLQEAGISPTNAAPVAAPAQQAPTPVVDPRSLSPVEEALHYGVVPDHLAQLRSAIISELGIDIGANIRVSDSLMNHYNFSSSQLTDLALRLEDTFGISIPNGEVQALMSGNILEILKRTKQ